MKKGYYYIMNGHRKSQSIDFIRNVELVRGFIDENGLYGYRYIREPGRSRWECRDLKSGLLVVEKKTIDECVKHTIDFEHNLNCVRDSKSYEREHELFNQLINEQHMKDDAEFNAGW